jgi:hypothetical protein
VGPPFSGSFGSYQQFAGDQGQTVLNQEAIPLVIFSQSGMALAVDTVTLGSSGTYLIDFGYSLGLDSANPNGVVELVQNGVTTLSNIVAAPDGNLHSRSIIVQLLAGDFLSLVNRSGATIVLDNVPSATLMGMVAFLTIAQIA